MAEVLLTRREDWTEFRNLGSIGRKAGVALANLVRLVAKELADNAFDIAGSCTYGLAADNGFFVADEGAGIPGTDEEIADLYSVSRPLTSSKRIRSITRGALGHGLRVAVGAVLATGGRLSVSTRGRTLHLTPQDVDGTSRIDSVKPWEGQGTRACIWFGPSLVVGPDVFAWCDTATELAGAPGNKFYSGKSSPFWYDGDAFWELLQSSRGYTIREVVKGLEGCSRKAGDIASEFFSRPAESLSREDADRLFRLARDHSEPVKARRLGMVGRLDRFTGHAKEDGTFRCKAGRSTLEAVLPFVVEAWAVPAEESSILVCVNRTPITAEVDLRRDGAVPTALAVFGCNLRYRIEKVGRKKEFKVLLNVLCPHLPLTTDGKEPDLGPLHSPIVDAIEAAIRRAKKASPRPDGRGEAKAAIVELLPQAVAHASGNGRSRYSPRQLFYATRKYCEERGLTVPSWSWFQKVIGQVEEAQSRDLDGISRDNRGVLYHPHTRQEIPLGTISVEKYRRPEWAFNKVLYSEKEALFPILKDAGWPERWDCALLTSKGFATRAAKDVIDLLGETTEGITFHCIHDADGPGTVIFESLQGASLARPTRKVKVVNLGLEPAEGRGMGLQVEAVERKINGKTGKPRTVPVAGYVPAADRRWLQDHRVELNAMTGPEFIRWLDQKMEAHDEGKVIPPRAVVEQTLETELRRHVADAEQERILNEAGFDGLVQGIMQRFARSVSRRAKDLAEEEIAEALEETPEDSWREPVSEAATILARRKK